MFHGVEGVVLQLGSDNPREARRAIREAETETTPFERIERALFIIGFDLVETTFSPRDTRAPIIVWGDDVVLVTEPTSFDAVAKAVGGSEATELRASLPVKRRPLQALAKRSDWGRLAALLDMERSDLWVVMTYAAAIGLTTLATPVAVQALFDVVAFGTLLQPLVVVGLLLLAVLVFSGVLRVLEFIAVELIARRIFVRTATDFAHRLPLVDRTAIDSRDLREKVTRFLDVGILEKNLSVVLFDGTTAVLQIGAGLLLLAFYHPLLLAFDVVLIAGIAVVVFLLGRRAAETALAESKQKYRISAWLGELAAAPNVFSGTSGVKFAGAKADDLLREWLAARRAQWNVQLRQFSGMLLLQIGAGVGLLLIGGALVINRQLTLGQLVAAELVMSVTVASLAKLGKLFGKVYDLVASLQKLTSVVELPLRGTSGERLRGHSALSISGAGAVIAAGERVAIVNPPREWVELGGALLVDGAPVRDLSSANLRDNVMVLSENEVFAGDVLENLSVVREDLTHGVARQALPEDLAAAGLLDRTLGTRGAGLDPRERAEVLVARATIHQPRIIIVDHLFDDLDIMSVDRLTKRLRALEATLVVLTRRHTVAPVMDRTIDLSMKAEAA